MPRPRLSERLDRGARSTLTLISAPVGFGKTTLLAEWLAAAPADRRSVAWVSLDPGDGQPVPFWTYLFSAIRTVAPGVGASALSLLQEPQPPPIETILATVLNELAATTDEIVLVLDDYHMADTRDIQGGMAYLLEHLPPSVHVVITTRADPALPLARLRASGELVEIRAADLRFTPDEAAAYLNGMMGLGLAARDVEALEGRTEGWIAALQLAALSVQGRDDVAGFIDGFAGDDRYIVDYLVEEVLQRQPEDLRSFLLETSILARLDGSLCDAVTGREGGKAMLEALDRGNLFLVPLDDRRRWYRYHQLFADVLRARVLDERPGHIAELHRRAAAWYEEHGEQAEAIDHAIAGGDFARAAGLIEVAIPAMVRQRREAAVRPWLEALPDDLLRERPVLSNAYAGSLLVRGEVEGVEERLRDAERWLDAGGDAAARVAGPQGPMVVVDAAAFRRLPGSVAVHRAGQARLLGDVAGTVAHARRALDLVVEDDHLARGGAAGLLALASWTAGDLEEASRWYAAGMASLEMAGHLSDVIGCALAVADIRLAQGRLHDALRTYERGLQLATREGRPPLRGAADMHVGMSELACERDDLHAASQHLLTSRGLGDGNGLPQNPYRSHVAAARIRQAEGDVDGALELLDEAERLYVGDFSPDVRPVAALRARAWVAQGRTAEALGWARDRGVSAEDDLSYLREFEHVTLARVLLARSAEEGVGHPLEEAAGLLERLRHAAEDGGRAGSLIEILVLQSLAHGMRRELPRALETLEGALALAEPEGYVRVFVDEGPSMADLVREAARRRIAPAYATRLLAAFGDPRDGARVRQALVEPLSERELDVLQLLATDLDGPGIAAELVVSLNTVRTHTKNIYAKLGVNSRRAAVRRATELDLMTRSRRDRPRPASLQDG